MADRKPAKLARAIYGTILVTAVVAALSEDEDANPLEIGLAVLATSLVFWLAHVYASMLATSVGGRLTFAHARELAMEEWPLVQSSALPIAALLLAPVGVVSDYTAESLAIGVGLATLFLWGLLFGRRQGLAPLGLLLVATVNVAFGAAIVALKTAFH
jgi:hypothetical protein